MAQHDYDIANADGATVRADINSVLEAIASLNSGSTAPSTTFPFMWWADTSAGILKRRNSANNAWISVMSLTTGLIIGTDVQSYDAALASLATLGSSLVAGDILYATAADTLQRLAKGTDGQVLTLASGVPSWAAASSGPTRVGGSVSYSGGTPTLDADEGIASITDNGTGDTTFTFDSAFSNALYRVAGAAVAPAASNSIRGVWIAPGGRATGSCRVECGANAGREDIDFTVEFFGT